MDRRIKFRHLDAFSAIARARSFKAAAEQLNLTQPAISHQLKRLGEETNSPNKAVPRCAKGCVVSKPQAKQQAN